MERFRLSDLVKDVEMGGDIDVVIAADAQRALDAEREKVKELEQKLQDMTESKVRCWNQWTFAEQEVKEQGDQLATLQAQVKQLDRTLADVYQQRDGLQAQLRQVEGDAPLTDEQRAIRDCCEKPHDCKWGGLGGCGYEGRKYELKQDALQPKGGRDNEK